MVCRPSPRSSTGIEHTRVPAGRRLAVFGPWSTTSAQNSCPMTMSREKSKIRVPSART